MPENDTNQTLATLQALPDDVANSEDITYKTIRSTNAIAGEVGRVLVHSGDPDKGSGLTKISDTLQDTMYTLQGPGGVREAVKRGDIDSRSFTLGALMSIRAVIAGSKQQREREAQEQRDYEDRAPSRMRAVEVMSRSPMASGDVSRALCGTTEDEDEQKRNLQFTQKVLGDLIEEGVIESMPTPRNGDVTTERIYRLTQVGIKRR
jgi:hypothetical protein